MVTEPGGDVSGLERGQRQWVVENLRKRLVVDRRRGPLAVEYRRGLLVVVRLVRLLGNIGVVESSAHGRHIPFVGRGVRWGGGRHRLHQGGFGNRRPTRPSTTTNR